MTHTHTHSRTLTHTVMVKDELDRDSDDWEKVDEVVKVDEFEVVKVDS